MTPRINTHAPLATLREESYIGQREPETIKPVQNVGGSSLTEQLLRTMTHPTKARDIASFCSGIQIVRLILSLAIHRDISDKDDKSDKKKLLLLKVRKTLGKLSYHTSTT